MSPRDQLEKGCKGMRKRARGKLAGHNKNIRLLSPCPLFAIAPKYKSQGSKGMESTMNV